MKYILENSNDGMIETADGIEEAAKVILSDDGYTHSVRQEDDTFWLYTSNHSRASTAYNGETKSVIFSLEENEDAARADIYKQVINHDAFTQRWYPMTIQDYIDQQFQINAENETDPSEDKQLQEVLAFRDQ